LGKYPVGGDDGGFVWRRERELAEVIILFLLAKFIKKNLFLLAEYIKINYFCSEICEDIRFVSFVLCNNVPVRQ
jgi:hypothetical protein